MRKLVGLVLSIFLFFSFTVPLEAKSRKTITVTVPEDTPLDARFVEDIRTDEAEPGQRILLVVDKDVLINGYRVIESGARVIAEIREVNDAGLAGQGGKIDFLFLSVTAVDNQDIKVYGFNETEGEEKIVQSVLCSYLCCPLFLLMQGEEGVIKAGQTVRLHTEKAAKVKVRVVRQPWK